ncbi:hypothetical protein C8Q77DRAFT_1211554 [Trametes polyzona]|nr:hypothetical protein C8Q77DRAFT_1211554 [Trametes polyzona]
MPYDRGNISEDSDRPSRTIVMSARLEQAYNNTGPLGNIHTSGTARLADSVPLQNPPTHHPYSMDSTQTCLTDENLPVFSQLTLGPRIGVAYVGVAISSMMYGITCIQTFQYYRSPRSISDTMSLRVTVFILWLLDSTHQAFIIHIMYHYLVQNYANTSALLHTVWSIPTEVLVDAVITGIVEIIFVVRVWKLSKNTFVTGACTVFAFTHLVMFLVSSTRMFFYDVLVEGEMKLETAALWALGAAVLADISMSSAMVWCLHKGRTGLRKSRSDDMMGRLIILTITTGSFTTLFGIADFVAYLAAPSQLYGLFFNFMLGKLYINSLLTMLNSRAYLRGGTGVAIEIDSSPLRASTFRGELGQTPPSDVNGPVILASAGGQGRDQIEWRRVARPSPASMPHLIRTWVSPE